jgi:CHAT domain-containing protein/tetratricopeptide (TPR) repeat protein
MEIAFMRTFSCAALIACSLLLERTPAVCSSTDTGQEPLLMPGAQTGFELEVGASRRHPLMLEAGQFLQVELREKGPRIVVALLDEKGSTLARREAPTDTITTLRLLAVAPATGPHVLEVRSAGEGRGGRYEIRMEEPRPAAERERGLVAADEALAEAVRLSNEGTGESRRRALVRLEAAETGFGEAGDRLGQALALLKRGRLQFDAGQPGASESIERSRGLFRELGDREGEGAALIDLGATKLRTGDLEAARGLFDDAARGARATGGQLLLSASLSHIGITLGRTGQAERAVEFFDQALSVATEAGSRWWQARAANGLGVAHRSLGELEKALENYERALSLARALGHRYFEAAALGNIARVHMELGDDVRALAFLEQALPLAQAAGSTSLEANNLNNVAKVLGRRGEHDRAIELGRRSLQLRRQMHERAEEAATLHTLGRNLYLSGETEAGLDHVREALRIQHEIRERYNEGDTMATIATIERDRGNLREALAQAEAAVTLTEELRSAVTNPDLRASFVAAEQDIYGLCIDILMRLHEQDPARGHDAAALQTSERARARVLLDALIEARADIREGVEPALLERERALQVELSRASAVLSGVLARDAATPEEVRRARQALEVTSAEYRRLQSRLRGESPRYAALTQPVPATVNEIRRDLLDPDTVLLEFHLGKDRSFLWAVTSSALVSQTLPGLAPIEAAARKVHALMIERQRSRGPAAAREADRQLETESAALSGLLLGGIGARLDTDWKGKRLLFVASGALAYLPFGALPSPGDGAPRSLLSDHEIVFAPSASVLIALRRDRGAAAKAGDSVAVLADPVFDAADPRVRPRSPSVKKPPSTPIGLTRAMDSLGRGGFARLPFSRGEADAIAAFVPRASLLKATDFAANRALVAQGALGDRRIVHFATHGLLDSEHPDLSGLVLSLVDEKGKPQDGFLRMHEIYNLRLPVELVVLSACQTALGREIRGEGLIGLTRGFMYAGARRVVASLWQVDDESTAELMKRFYRSMLKDGRPPSAALRVAQLEMSRDRRWSAPFYWAGFVLQGEWR